jgi:hypothetical protein
MGKYTMKKILFHLLLLNCNFLMTSAMEIPVDNALYKCLNISRDASSKQIHYAFTSLSELYNPRNYIMNSELEQQQVAKINRIICIAYFILENNNLRAYYNSYGFIPVMKYAFAELKAQYELKIEEETIKFKNFMDQFKTILCKSIMTEDYSSIDMVGIIQEIDATSIILLKQELIELFFEKLWLEITHCQDSNYNTVIRNIENALRQYGPHANPQSHFLPLFIEKVQEYTQQNLSKQLVNKEKKHPLKKKNEKHEPDLKKSRIIEE